MTGGSLPELSIALSDNENTRPILDGRVAPQGMRLKPLCLHPSEMFWRQLKSAEFDISEMSISSLLIAWSRGDRRFAALPVFTMRRFFHTGILVRRDRAIASPGDLRGKRVGVPEYQQTAAIWIRGILDDEFGVKPQDIEWFMERVPERSHGGATGFVPPPGVRIGQIPPSSNIGSMMVSGELDATLLYLPERNAVDRSRIDLSEVTNVTTLFPDPAAEARRYYAKTHIHPINHTLVVRRELLERDATLAARLFDAFVAAKTLARRDAAAVLRPYFDLGLIDPAAERAFATDPMEYGLAANRHILDTVAGYVHRQGLLARPLAIDELFQ